MRVKSIFSQTRKPYYFVYAFGAGVLSAIAIGSFFAVHAIVLYVLAMTALAIAILAPRYPWSLWLLVVCGLLCGFVRWQFVRQNMVDATLNQMPQTQQTYLAQVAAEPDIRTDRQQLTVKLRTADNQPWLPALALVTLPLYPEYGYGDQLQLYGWLERPAVFPDFDYARYLQRQGIAAVLYYPDTHFYATTSSWYGQLLEFKQLMIRRVNELLPEPEAAFLNGLLWGAKRAIPTELLAEFSATGTTHIIALSGYNITVLGVIIFSLVPWLGMNRKHAFWLVLAIICLFILLTGYPASVVRAGIMGILVLIAYRWGGGVKPGILLTVSAVVMCLVNPYVLVWDVGFQLSFLATIGLVYLSPLLERWLPRIPRRFGLRETILATSSAIILTAPLIVYQFGRVSVVGLLANLLILAVIPAAMALGFAAVITSWVWYPVGQVCAWAGYALLHYVIRIVEMLGSWPYASVEIVSRPNALWLAAVYIVLGLIISFAYVRQAARP